MKKLVITSLATVGLALGAFAQGGIVVDNSQAAHGFVLGNSASFYDGPIGLQVWFQNGTTFQVSGINGQANNPGAAYSSLSSSGFTLATTFVNASSLAGGVSLGDLHIPGVTPGGSTVTLAIAAWQGSGAAFPTAGNGNGGVLAFYQPTADYTIVPTPTSPDLTAATGGFNTTDLHLNAVTAVPEPSTFALAGLGAAAMLIFRRRK